MKNKFPALILILFLCSCFKNRINVDGPCATIMIIHKYDPITGSEGESNEKKELALIDSIFLNAGLISAITQKINHPRYNDPVYIRKRILTNRLENKVIDIKLFIKNEEFSKRFLNELVDAGLNNLEIKIKDGIKKEEDLYQKKVDSIANKNKIFEEKIESEKNASIRSMYSDSILRSKTDMIKLLEEFTLRKIKNAGKNFQNYKIVDRASYYNGLDPS